MSDQVDAVGRRMTGEVVRDGAEFGFLSCDELPGQDIYYKNAWLQGGGHRLQQGERVTFELVVYGDKQQAHELRRVQELPTRDRSVLVQYLFDWAYVGYVPNCLSELQGLALPGERWEFRNTPPDPARPSPILYSYLVQTFARLVLETKVRLTADHSFAAFNTGLVDRRYEPIHALFVPNDGRAPWQLAGFCIAGEGVHGQNLVRSFAPLPASAHYFADPRELLYNVAAGPPSLDWAHIILDRIDRYPKEFIEDNRPKDFVCKDPADLDDQERVGYYAALRSAVVAERSNLSADHESSQRRRRPLHQASRVELQDCDSYVLPAGSAPSTAPSVVPRFRRACRPGSGRREDVVRQLPRAHGLVTRLGLQERPPCLPSRQRLAYSRRNRRGSRRTRR